MLDVTGAPYIATDGSWLAHVIVAIQWNQYYVRTMFNTYIYIVYLSRLLLQIVILQ